MNLKRRVHGSYCSNEGIMWVEISSNEYYHWDCFSKWWSSDTSKPVGFRQWLVREYPVVINAKDRRGGMALEFESEDHYRWFLLQVM